MTSLLAIDPSLTSSGWVLFSLEQGKPLSAGLIKPPGTELALAHRLETLQEQIRETLCMLKLGENDFLVCEGPAHLVLNPNSALKVERVRSIFESVARSRGLRVPGRLNPRTVQTELLGFKGPQVARAEVKACARTVALRMFINELRAISYHGVKRGKNVPQDIIDALLIGSLASSRVQHAIKNKLSPEEMFLPKPKGDTSGARGTARWSIADLKKQKKQGA